MRLFRNATRFDEMQFRKLMSNHYLRWFLQKQILWNGIFQVFSWILSLDFGQPILRHTWKVSCRCSLNLPPFLSTSRLVASACRIFDLLTHLGQHLPPEDELGREELRILLGLDRDHPRASDRKGWINSTQFKIVSQLS